MSPCGDVRLIDGERRVCTREAHHRGMCHDGEASWPRDRVIATGEERGRRTMDRGVGIAPRRRGKDREL